jgi:transposase
MDVLLQEWKTCEEQIAQVDEKIVERARQPEPGKVLSTTQILVTAPGVNRYSGLTLASRIGPVGFSKFPEGRKPGGDRDASPNKKG